MPHCHLGTLAALSAVSQLFRTLCRPRLLLLALVQGQLETSFRRKSLAKQRRVWGVPGSSRRSPLGSLKLVPQVQFCRAVFRLAQVEVDPPRTGEEVVLSRGGSSFLPLWGFLTRNSLRRRDGHATRCLYGKPLETSGSLMQIGIAPEKQESRGRAGRPSRTVL